MMAAAQPFLSGAISKTVNLPEDCLRPGHRRRLPRGLAARHQGRRHLPRQLQGDAAAERLRADRLTKEGHQGGQHARRSPWPPVIPSEVEEATAAALVAAPQDAHRRAGGTASSPSPPLRSRTPTPPTRRPRPAPSATVSPPSAPPSPTSSTSAATKATSPSASTPTSAPARSSSAWPRKGPPSPA